MKLAQYWARQTVGASDLLGKPIQVAARGWSNDSREAAEAMARDVASRIVHLLAGKQTEKQRYLYGERPLPEPVVREFQDRSGLSAVVTRNCYGALVLNARDMMFIDIDEADKAAGPPVAGLISGLMSMFGRKPEPPPPAIDTVVREIQRVAELHQLTLRVYKTAAGHRALVLNAPFDPNDAQTEALLREFGSDPLYIRLCKRQESFRARLTPKPWRSNSARPPVTFPFETPREQERFNRWEVEYASSTARYATCRFVTQIGSGGTAPGFDDLVSYHDQETKALSGLPLA